MTEKRDISKKIEPEQVIIHGRVQVKESRRPVPDLLVQVFWVNPTWLKGKNRSWYENIGNDNVVRFAGEEITSASGAFSLPLYMKNVLGDQPVIGLAVFVPDDADKSENPEPVYISPVPRATVNRRTFLLAIPATRLEAAGQLLPKPPTATEILNSAEDRDKEISDWLKADQKMRDDTVKKVVVQSSNAFKNFRPSTVPESVRKHDNYLEERGKLKETLAKVREKNLKQLEDSNKIKPREIIMSKAQAEELGLTDENKTVKTSFREVTKILGSVKLSREAALQSTLLAVKQRKECDQKIVETLYSHFIQMNQDEQ